jgi:hypothetical protein
MINEVELNVIKANAEIASTIAQWKTLQARKSSKGNVALPARLKDRSPAITNPAGFWSMALTENKEGQVEVSEIEQSLKLTAAKIKAGDSSFVIESGLGQVAWLSSLAIELKADADDQPVDSVARERLLRLSFRAQGAAAKLMLSIGVMSQISDNSSTLVNESSDEI